jgi:sugar O-acyltransferase (sialic acid O-acetyltransferase NeuD family)
MNTLRQTVFADVTARGWTCATFVHPGVKIWSSTRLGQNVFIFEDNTIQPFTTIGDNTIFWSGNHLGHHSSVGSHCFISSHVVISGSCRLGDNLFVGVNATFHDGLTIADHCLIGAGAIITRDTNPHEVYVPASTKPFPKASHELDF